jgi:hypothetical protein
MVSLYTLSETWRRQTGRPANAGYRPYSRDGDWLSADRKAQAKVTPLTLRVRHCVRQPVFRVGSVSGVSA